MRIFHVLLMTLAGLLSWAGVSCAQTAAAQTPSTPFAAGGTPHIAARLESESPVPAPGRTVTLAFVMQPGQGWHGYWENPGDAGIGMSVEWTLPPGVTAGPLRYPVPETLLISGLMNYVYEGRYAVLTTLTLPPSMQPGTPLPIRAKGEWLACTRQICVPEGGEMIADLIVGDGAVPADRQSAFDGYRTHLPRPLGSEARFSAANGRFRLAVPFPAGAQVEQPYFFSLTDGALTYAAPQAVSRSGDMLIVETDRSAAAPQAVRGVLRTGDHVGLVIDARPGTVPAAGEPVGGAKPGGILATVLLALGGAILGGLILNVMPCVFPILSLKALSLARAGGEAGPVRREAIAYTIGVVVTCLLLGIILLALRAAGQAAGWAFQLQDPRIILFLLLLVTGIALNMAGLFALRSFDAGGELAGKSGAAGAFWTGALVAFVATPCTGPFMAGALGAALVLPWPAALAIFAGLGLGLALPFLLIGLVPAIRRRLPRPGAWMERLQKILSVPMFLTALALAWLLGRQVGAPGMTVGVAAALLSGLLLWWLGTRQRAGKAGGIACVLALALVLGGAVLLLPRTGAGGEEAAAKASGTPFSEERLAALRAADTPVFLYFTADWCLTCKANEAAAIDRTEVRAAFAQAGVTTMVGDWTRADPAITRFLEAQGRSGVPLYLWYAPGRPARVLPQVLDVDMLTGLANGG
ncbi:MAG: thiol:disulfide interchange protein [Sphingobium sp.]|nr:MAG: thiol:disulfide interchange protein [Sphingobium sp.]